MELSNDIKNLAKQEWFPKLMEELGYVKPVRCKYCKHRILNEHYGEKGYMKLKAICELDSGDPFELSRCAEDDDWYCADGERKDEVVHDD